MDNYKGTPHEELISVLGDRNQIVLECGEKIVYLVHPDYEHPYSGICFDRYRFVSGKTQIVHIQGMEAFFDDVSSVLGEIGNYSFSLSYHSAGVSERIDSMILTALSNHFVAGTRGFKCSFCVGEDSDGIE